MEPALCLGPDRNPRRPRQALPAGAIDCHCHLFEDQTRYPLGRNRSYTPPLCTAADYRRLMDVLGIERTVQVNASVYNHDNSVTLDLIKAWGQHRARGIAGLAPDATEAEVRRLHDGGMRGVRLSTRVKGYGGPERLAAIAARIKPFGWHVQVHVHDCEELAQLESQLMQHPTPIVFDHLGSVRGAEGVLSPGFQALLRLLAARNDFHVKISSWYRRSDAGAPYHDMRPMAQELARRFPDRCVFGTNWPHPVLFEGTMPNDGDLVDQFMDWIPDPAVQRQILVTNPARVYFN